MSKSKLFNENIRSYPNAHDQSIETTAHELTFIRYGKRRGKHAANLLRIQESKKLLTASYRYIRRSAKESLGLPLAAESFMEHFYIVEKALIALEGFDKDIASRREIYTTLEGESGNMPRIYTLAESILSTRDFRLTESAISAFLTEFQKTDPLESYELSYLPQVLRLVCIRQLCAILVSAVRTIFEYESADKTYTQIQKNITSVRKQREYIRDFLKVSESAGLSRLHSLLAESDEFELVSYMHSIISKENRTIEGENARTRQRNSRESAQTDNIIAALRTIDSMDWEELKESLSVVNEYLERDPIYKDMDTTSKRKLRQAVSEAANASGVTEAVAAMRAFDMTKNAEGKRAHVGYYFLTPSGRAELLSTLTNKKQKPLLNENKKLGIFIFVQVLFIVLFSAVSLTSGWMPGLLSILPAWAIASSIVVRLYSRFSGTSFIPRMNLDSLDSNDIRTVVLMPTLITDAQNLRSAITRMETHYLSNPLSCACFAVLGDFSDSKLQWNDGEEELLRDAENAVAALNKKYTENKEPVFYYLHRERTMNTADGLYMGRERKRGAIEDFVRLAINEEEGPFTCISDPLPKDIRYMVVLDSDTILPRDSLSALIGAAAHPLNKPVTDKLGIVKEGYGVIVPRMETTPKSAAKTRFSRMISGFCGISAYSDTVSDFYQDIFSEGIFGGKGIIDIEVFYNALNYRIRENTVLSHDLLEGSFVRAGYMSDVALFDGEPAAYPAWWKRQHRWIRGDWQLIPYLPLRWRDKSGSKHRSFISHLSRYKIFDNLRRSLIIPAAFAALIASLFTGFEFYTAVALVSLFIEPIISTLNALFTFYDGGIKKFRDLGLPWSVSLMRFAALPFEALRTLDACVRTLYRVFISHKKMLEWQTAAQSEKRSLKGTGAFAYYRLMWINILAAVICFVSMGDFAVPSFILGLIWLGAPALLYALDRPIQRETVSEDDKQTLRELAASIWRFFYELSFEETGFTPPDNYQELPQKPPVQNASPTNIGMGLMASVCAFDLGIIEADTLTARIKSSCSYIESLEKWNGHLFNWYDINTRQKLSPAYVSTVDSGNLAACMLLAAETLSEIDGAPAAECAKQLRKIVFDMDFRALYDEKRSLFHIGFDYHNGVLSRSWYDLLASEARLTYLVACALNQIPQKAWFSLGRLLVPTNDSRALISWGGTMFEYLMPAIFTEVVPGTLMAETLSAIVSEQKHYMTEQKKPWGISESGYYAFDRDMYYQYRAFGVPRLGLSPMREVENVTAPYAAVLALMIKPKEALSGLKKFAEISARGKYGFYEAVDFTETRVKTPGGFEIVKSYMAHHQGMSICAINNVLNDFVLQKRFHNIPEIRTVELLTQERLPSSAVTLKEYERGVYNDDSDTDDAKRRPRDKVRTMRSHYELPEGQMLANGDYTVFMCDNGVGFSKCRGIMLNRFRPDHMRGDQGVAVCLKHDDIAYDLAPAVSGQGAEDAYTVFEQHKIELFKKTGDISAREEICVSPDYNGEIRRITLINHGSRQKEIELGIFTDIALASQAEDIAHPAFVRLTVDAALEGDVLIFKRRGTKMRTPYYMYACLSGQVQPKYCTDRLQFPGRGRTYAESMYKPLLSSRDVESPIEPGLCARAEVTLKPGESTEFVFVMGFAVSRERALFECREILSADIQETIDLSWAKSNSALRFLGTSYGKAEVFERIGTRLLLNIPHKPKDMIHMPYSKDILYRYGISGDLPILLVKIGSQTKLRLVKTLLKQHEYMTYKGCMYDLVIVGDYPNEYVNELKIKLSDLISAALERFNGSKRSGHIHLIDGFTLSEEDMAGLMRQALIIVDPQRTLDRQFAPEKLKAPELKEFPRIFDERHAFALMRPKLNFDNGLGGFDTETDEYVIVLNREAKTPLPWSNILCNEGFGTVITESGGGYTWKNNCHDGRLTPWYNDAVGDKKSELLLLTDESSGETWTITPSNIQGAGDVIVRHGFGYTRFMSGNSRLRQTLTVFVDDVRPAKYLRITIKNPVMERREVSLMYTIDWDIPPEEAISEFSDGIMFVHGGKQAESSYVSVIGLIPGRDGEIEFSGNRLTVLNGGWLHEKLDGAVGSGFGSFSAVRTTISIAPGETREFAIVMGKAAPEKILEHVSGLNIAAIDDTLNRVKRMWNERLSGISIKTPDTALDTLFNKRLLYQVYTSRLMARTGLYQSGGAYGFRDQLQDALSLLYTNPNRAKGQILLCSSMQFEAGDVLHWWHAPYRGVRTRIVDDRLFLPYVTAKYCQVTGDYDILNQKTPYLKDVPIPDGQKDIYFQAEHSLTSERLYDHCMRAIRSTFNFGAHGLPLMEGGDWNDGMDCVGRDGGESVFLAFFLQRVIADMLLIVKRRGSKDDVRELEEVQSALKQAVESTAWDGGWYLRAYYGDGTALGSHNSAECSVDLLSQVWSVFAGAEHAEEAYLNALSVLMDKQNGVIALLTPPFYNDDDTKENRPGYIESYLPGVRENGGQYTHAAVWSIMAACVLGLDELAMQELSLINPIEKTAHNEGMLRYKGEPYVMAGDVYSIGKNASRAGWTWYTGSAAWLYNVIVEHIVGIRKHGDRVTFKPHNTWDSFEVDYRFMDTLYQIKFLKSENEYLKLDDTLLDPNELILKNDKRTHTVYVGFKR